MISSIFILLCLIYSILQIESYDCRRKSVVILRGGGLSNDELDAYVNQLIEDEPTTSSTGGESEIEQEEEVMKGKDISAVDVEEEEEEEVEFMASKGDEEKLTEDEMEEESIETKTNDEDETSLVDAELPKKRKKRKKKKEKIETKDGVPDVDKAAETVEKPVELENDVKKPTKEVAMKPPPAFFRFLLMRGRVGHVILMTCVMVGEFLELYIPELYSLLLWLFTKIRLYNPNEFDAKRYPQEERSDELIPGVNEQYAAFVDTTTGTAGGNKATKKQRQAAAKVATQKLKSLGETKLAKYKHLSDAFMKRHNLGKYAQEQKLYENVIGKSLEELEKSEGGSRETITDDSDEQNIEEEDDWVVKALMTDNNDDGDGRIDDSDGDKRMQSVLEAAVASRSDQQTTNTKKKKRKIHRPKASDRDGGGGMFGRLRAVGANNIMTSRILGAYPGDAVPIQDAANSNGIIDLAYKYGYGEWSSDDEDESHFSFSSMKKKRKRRRKKQRSSSSSNGLKILFGNGSDDHSDKSGVSISFGIGTKSSSSSNSHTRSSSRRRRRMNLTRRTSTRHSFDNDNEPFHSLTRPRSNDHERSVSSSPSAVQLPMRRTQELRAQLQEKDNDNKRDSPFPRRSASSSPSAVRLPMRRTQELRAQLLEKDADES